jgi:L-ascorbate metabolism protein UlaG (beta-lactamase superfamily)
MQSRYLTIERQNSRNTEDPVGQPVPARTSRVSRPTPVAARVGAHLERWGVPAARIIELDWWDSRSFGDLTLWSVQARHASGRMLFVDDGAKLWAGYAFVGARHRVYCKASSNDV